MMLSDKVARRDVERGIPTGGLYRGITHNAWVSARDELRAALTQALGAQPAAEPVAWPIKGVRVDGDNVVVSVWGGNDAARWLCGALIAKIGAKP